MGSSRIIEILTRVCKEDYYKSFFQDNKKVTATGLEPRTT